MSTEYKVMLAPSKLADVPNLDYPILVQPKYDGFRATYIPGRGFVSRTGKKFRNKYLDDYFSRVFEDAGNTVLDGELYVPNTPFQELASTVSTEDAKITVQLRFAVFDAIPLDDWEKRSCGLNYASRLRLLRQVVNRISDYTKVLDSPTDKVNNSAELVKLYRNYLTDGLEGVMIKSENGPYHWGRVGFGKQTLLKLKPFKSEDLKVTGMFDGKGKLEGTIGGIICDFAGNAVRVGTGFSMSDRATISQDKNGHIGKIAEIKYLEKTKDGKSLRHPVFARWRDDK